MLVLYPREHNNTEKTVFVIALSVDRNGRRIRKKLILEESFAVVMMTGHTLLIKDCGLYE